MLARRRTGATASDLVFLQRSCMPPVTALSELCLGSASACRPMRRPIRTPLRMTGCQTLLQCPLQRSCPAELSLPQGLSHKCRADLDGPWPAAGRTEWCLGKSSCPALLQTAATCGGRMGPGPHGHRPGPALLQKVSLLSDSWLVPAVGCPAPFMCMSQYTQGFLKVAGPLHDCLSPASPHNVSLRGQSQAYPCYSRCLLQPGAGGIWPAFTSCGRAAGGRPMRLCMAGSVMCKPCSELVLV